jgi:hypothetical protein
MVPNRYYNCYYFAYGENNKFLPNSNVSCWAGLTQSAIKRNWHNGYITKGWKTTFIDQSPMKDDNIYITRYKNLDVPLAHTKRILKIINKITPCKIVTVKKKPYIKYTLINNRSYYHNLLLLNIIRMCWYKPSAFNYQGYYKDIMTYKESTDPLYFLMEKIRDNVKPLRSGYGYLNHSPIMLGIVPKITSRLLETQDISQMSSFLTLK